MSDKSSLRFIRQLHRRLPSYSLRQLLAFVVYSSLVMPFVSMTRKDIASILGAVLFGWMAIEVARQCFRLVKGKGLPDVLVQVPWLRWGWLAVRGSGLILLYVSTWMYLHQNASHDVFAGAAAATGGAWGRGGAGGLKDKLGAIAVLCCIVPLWHVHVDVRGIRRWLGRIATPFIALWTLFVLLQFEIPLHALLYVVCRGIEIGQQYPAEVFGRVMEAVGVYDSQLNQLAWLSSTVMLLSAVNCLLFLVWLKYRDRNSPVGEYAAIFWGFSLFCAAVLVVYLYLWAPQAVLTCWRGGFPRVRSSSVFLFAVGILIAVAPLAFFAAAMKPGAPGRLHPEQIQAFSMPPSLLLGWIVMILSQFVQALFFRPTFGHQAAGEPVFDAFISAALNNTQAWLLLFSLLAIQNAEFRFCAPTRKRARISVDPLTATRFLAIWLMASLTLLLLAFSLTWFTFHALIQGSRVNWIDWIFWGMNAIGEDRLELLPLVGLGCLVCVFLYLAIRYLVCWWRGRTARPTVDRPPDP